MLKFRNLKKWGRSNAGVKKETMKMALVLLVDNPLPPNKIRFRRPNDVPPFQGKR